MKPLGPWPWRALNDRAGVGACVGAAIAAICEGPMAEDGVGVGGIDRAASVEADLASESIENDDFFFVSLATFSFW